MPPFAQPWSWLSKWTAATSCSSCLTLGGMVMATPSHFPKNMPPKLEIYIKFVLPKHLSHSHGKDIFCWFTPEAIAEACKMGWDDCPITQDRLDLCDSLLTLDLEWCIPSTTLASSTTTSSLSINFDNNTVSLFQTHKDSTPTSPYGGQVVKLWVYLMVDFPILGVL